MDISQATIKVATTIVYVGDGSENASQPHSLGRVPRGVILLNTSSAEALVHISGSYASNGVKNHSCTNADVDNIYVGMDATFEGNVSGKLYRAVVW